MHYQESTDKDYGQVAARSIYFGSNGCATRSFYCKLEKQGALGMIAAQLFRVQKASSRAKVYRGGIRHKDGSRQSYTDLAYERKDECIERLCDLLDADDCGIEWGWGYDDKQPTAKNVLYVELPNGQVSFHCMNRHTGADFKGEWDQTHLSEERVIEFSERVFRQGEEK